MNFSNKNDDSKKGDKLDGYATLKYYYSIFVSTVIVIVVILTFKMIIQRSFQSEVSIECESCHSLI